MALGSTVSADGLEENQLSNDVADDSLDFEAWTRLIATVEHMFPDDIDKISLVYDSFLSEFPLCYGYWKQYADHMSRLCSVTNVVQIFERAVESVPYCLGVWVDYCSFSVSSFAESSDVRRLFERALSFVGKDYLCYVLWDKYIEFEYSQEQWDSLANIYIQTLKFPTKKLHHYYDSFKKLVAIWEEEKAGFQEIAHSVVQSIHIGVDGPKVSEDDDICHVINDLLHPSTRIKALQKYISLGESFYQRACAMDDKIQIFEKNIRRPYFHVKPLDDSQLQNWHRYLNHVEMEDDFDWAVKLYERCLVSCAHYPEFWMRYVDFMESKGGREIAADALNRATNIFVKNSFEIHLFNAWFKEKAGDIDGVHAAFLQCDQDYGSHLIDLVCRKANVEKRLGNYDRAANIYKEALDIAATKRPDTLPVLYVHYARLQHMITNSVEATREVLLNGIQCAPHSKLLLEISEPKLQNKGRVWDKRCLDGVTFYGKLDGAYELIHFASIHDGAKQVDILESVMARFLTFGSDVSGAFGTEEQEEVSRLYLEFIDSCGSINDIRKAWNRHLKLFPHFVRRQSSYKRYAKAGAVLRMIAESRPETRKAQDMEKLEQSMCRQAPPEDGHERMQGMGLVPSEGVSSPVRNEDKADEFCRGTSHGTDDKTYTEVAKNSWLNGIQKDREQTSKEARPSKEESDYVKGSSGVEGPQEASRPRCSSPVGGHDIDRIPTTSSPVNHVDKEVSETQESPTRRRQNSLRSLSPDHPSGHLRHNSYNGNRSEVGSQSNSRERSERSLSPRRRSSHGYSDNRYRRERSLSPRRNNSRWQSEERWQRERRHRRNTRYQDNSRGYKDGRIQNQHVVVIGSTGQPHNLQQQTMGSASQNQLPAQSTVYPQTQTNQYSQPSNEPYGSVQNSQVYNQMWQMYYQQQQLLQPPTASQLQLRQGITHQQQQQNNPGQPQEIPTNQQLQLQQTVPQGHLQYQQQQLYQQPQLEQQQPTNEQSQSDQQLLLQQQMQLPQQHLYSSLQHQQQGQQHQLQPQVKQPLQMQQQSVLQLQKQQPQQQEPLQQQQVQFQQQQEVYIQQQQQSYQYQQLQQQQYLLYLQQLHQYQHSQQQSGLLQDQKLLQKQIEFPEDQLEQDRLDGSRHGSEKLQAQRDDESPESESIRGSHLQNQGQEHTHASTSSGAAGLSQLQKELPEIEGTEI